MRTFLASLWAGCVHPLPAAVPPTPMCVDPAEGAPTPGYPVLVSVDPVARTGREAAFRAETGLPWSFVEIRRDGRVRHAVLPASPPDAAAADALLRDLARDGQFFGVSHPEVIVDCPITGDPIRTMTVRRLYDGRPAGAFSLSWVPEQGVVQLWSDLVPNLVGPAPAAVSDGELTARLLERLRTTTWRLRADPEVPHPCDCADHGCRSCKEYAREMAEGWFAPIDQPVELVPEHVRWTRVLGRFGPAVDGGPEEIRVAAVAALVPREGEGGCGSSRRTSVGS